MFERHFNSQLPHPHVPFGIPPTHQAVFIVPPAPPQSLVIKPRKVWLRERLMDIILAISLRTLQDQVVPEEWLTELATITIEINEMIEEGRIS